MMRFGLSISLMVLAFSLMAGINPTIVYKTSSAEYSIHWDTKFAQINNLSPEIGCIYKHLPES